MTDNVFAISLKVCTKCREELPATVVFFPHKDEKLLSQCRVCVNRYQRDYRIKNPDFQRQADKKHYAIHGDKRRAAALAWNKANPEKRSRTRRIYYANNTEAVLTKQRVVLREWHAQHPEKMAIYTQRSYEKDPIRTRASRAVIAARRRARERELPDLYTLEDWQYACAYWNHTCAICGISKDTEGVKLAQDHWIPLGDPECPGTVPWNIVPLCHRRGGCNRQKHDKPAEVFLRKQCGSAEAASAKHETILTFLRHMQARVESAA